MTLPPLHGAQEESWAALVELAPGFGKNWLLVGGQMVFLHMIERHVTDLRATDDIDVGDGVVVGRVERDKEPVLAVGEVSELDRCLDEAS